MKLILAHRGKLNNKSKENHPDQIKETLTKVRCEVDVRSKDKKLWLGHDKPEYKVEEWMYDELNILWHCKDYKSLEYINSLGLHCFYHTRDKYSFTNYGFPIVYPGEQAVMNSIIFDNNECYNEKDYELAYAIMTDEAEKWLD